MAQLNMHVSPEFEEILRRYMRLRGLGSKSEALRVAVREGIEAALRERGHTHFESWIGLGQGKGLNPRPKFASDDDVWEKS